MTPAQQVALDAMRSAWPEETVQRMMVAGQLFALLEAAVDEADQQDCGYCGSRHGNGRDLSCTECHWFSGAQQLVDSLKPTKTPPPSHVCEGPRADCWCAGLPGSGAG